jgi:chlorobactene glucosyltransferase
MILLLLYQLLILAVLLVLSGIVVVNLRVLPVLGKFRYQPKEAPNGKPAKNGKETTDPKVDVLVPARNEADNIEVALRSLVAQTYPNYEVWVYDDASTDPTLQIANRIADGLKNSKLKTQYAPLHVLSSKEGPPPGWLGKANACDQLYITASEQSHPDYILFTDADVRHAPRMLTQAIAVAQATSAGLVSIFPRQITLSWAERLVVPLMQHWAVYGILPLPMAFSRSTSATFSAANGQFMLFTVDAYKACGGHVAVRDKVLEDVELARAVKRAGYKVILADGGPLVQTRMYDGLDEVWRGYSKNTFAFFDNSRKYLGLGIAALSLLYIVPPLTVLLALLVGTLTLELFYLPLAQYLVAVITRLLLALRFAARPFDVLLHPVGIGMLIAILINSMKWERAGKGAWKGRAKPLTQKE